MSASQQLLPSIDIPTLAIARAIIQMTLAGLVIWTGNRQEQRSGTEWLASGLALHGLALLLFSIRFEPLDGLLTAANHLGFGFSSACILVGFWQFGKSPVRGSVLALVVTIPAISLLLWEWWYPNARWRILLTASGQVVFLLALYQILATPMRLEMSGIYRVLRWTTGLYLLLLIWAYGSAVELLPTTARFPTAYHGVAFSVGSMLFMLALAVGFLALQYSLLACRQADQARRDWLTGLLNRRGFLDAAASQSIGRNDARTFSVLAVDIDHFKRINDRHGHSAGDRVLEALARELIRHAGSRSIVGRMGGEEFELLLPDTDVAKGQETARTLCRECARLEIGARGGSIRFTVSIGVASRKPGETLEQVAERADAALYQAKQQGRNRVVLSDGDRHSGALASAS
jgi:diguanylate cyclase (GGDEF)-like protein